MICDPERPKQPVILSTSKMSVILSDPEHSEGESKDLHLLFAALEHRGFQACPELAEGRPTQMLSSRALRPARQRTPARQFSEYH
jgi:hypothetical protein